MLLPWPKWLRLPSRVALLLGMGALSAAGARADATHEVQGGGPEPLAQKEHVTSGDLLIWGKNRQLYFSEHGGRGEPLYLGDTAEARHLRQLLQQHGAESSAVRLDRMMLAGAGGKGISWGHWQKPAEVDNKRQTKTGGAEKTRDMKAPRSTGAPGNTNVAGSENKK
jgi:hypothetical protein